MGIDLSIIIVNWNTKTMLRNCLDSIQETADDLETQIIVIDNASSDGSRTMVLNDFAEVELMNSGGNIGFARANNLGLSRARAPFILFLNPDTIVRYGTLRGMVDFLKSHKNIGAVGCKIFDLKGIVQELPPRWLTPLRRFLALLLLSDSAQWLAKRFFWASDPCTEGYVPLLYGACLMVREETLREVGHFDERFFMYCEDIDLCYRIENNGWKIYYLPQYEIIHIIAGATSNSFNCKSDRILYESELKIMTKYYGTRGSVIFRTSVCLSSCLRLLASLFLIATAGLFSEKMKERFGYSAHKHILRIKWSISSKV